MADPIMTGQNHFLTLSNSDWSGEEVYDGHAGHVGLIPVYKQCTAAAPTIMTITSSKKGYVTFAHMYNNSAAAQTFTLDDAGTSTIILMIGAHEGVTWIAGKEPLFEVTGVVTGDAGTGNFIEVFLSYYEK